MNPSGGSEYESRDARLVLAALAKELDVLTFPWLRLIRRWSLLVATDDLRNWSGVPMLSSGCRSCVGGPPDALGTT